MERMAEDEAIVTEQLGRSPRGRWRVARRCHLGVPMIIETHPRLEDGSPFPTLYWLTCPVLVKRVSRLESGGYMSELNAILAEDPALAARQRAAIEDLLRRRDRLEVIDAGPPGGPAEHVMCLHARVANELAGLADPIGARVLSRTGWPDCVDACVRAEASP